MHILTYFSGHPDPENFLWDEYLLETGSTAAPISAFTLVRGKGGGMLGHRRMWRS